jgi:hypothetical protein
MPGHRHRRVLLLLERRGRPTRFRATVEILYGKAERAFGTTEMGAWVDGGLLFHAPKREEGAACCHSHQCPSESTQDESVSSHQTTIHCVVTHTLVRGTSRGGPAAARATCMTRRHAMKPKYMIPSASSARVRGVCEVRGRSRAFQTRATRTTSSNTKGAPHAAIVSGLARVTTHMLRRGLHGNTTTKKRISENLRGGDTRNVQYSLRAIKMLAAATTQTVIALAIMIMTTSYAPGQCVTRTQTQRLRSSPEYDPRH